MNTNIIKLEDIRRETFQLSVNELIANVVTREDFAVINGKIEPTRDLMLKLSTATKTSSMITELVKAENGEYIVKATVKIGNREASGLGACTVQEIQSRRKDTRANHDAIATAETRALKRAFEAAVGLPFINELILRLFGGYEINNEEKEIAQQLTVEEFIHKIENATHIKHLQNIWNKYRHNLNIYSTDDRNRVIYAKNKRKEELSNVS